jgi:hypothetical protein
LLRRILRICYFSGDRFTRQQKDANGRRVGEARKINQNQRSRNLGGCGWFLPREKLSLVHKQFFIF